MKFALKKIVLSDESATKQIEYKDMHTDVIVYLEEEDEEGKLQINKYIAAFFTYENLKTIRRENEKSGDFLNGKYFWANDLLLIDECTPQNIELVIKDLVDQGDFRTVFTSISV